MTNTIIQNPTIRFKDNGKNFPDWEEKKLGDIFNISAGGDIEKDKSRNTKTGEYAYPIFANSEKNKGLFGYANEFKIKDDCVTVTGRGNVGIAISRSEKFYPIVRLLVLKGKRTLSNNFFSEAINQLTIHCETTGVPQLTSPQLSAYKIKYPHLDEQKKIAVFLSCLDTKIELLQSKHTKMLAYKKGLMQGIFSQTIRFKDKEKKFPDWEEKKIKDIFTITRGNVLAVPKTKQKLDKINSYPVYSSQTKNKGIIGYYNEYLYENAITWTTDGAQAGDVNFRQGKFYCTNVCGVLISNNGYSNLCISEMINAISRKYVSYVGNPKLMNNVMANIKINIPHLDEQQKIADFLSIVDNKIENLEQKITKTKAFKNGVMQQMFV